LVDALLAPAAGVTVEADSIRLSASGADAVSLYDGSLAPLGIGPGLLLTTGRAPGLTNSVGWFGQDNSGSSGYLNGDADVDAVVNRVFRTKSYDATSLSFSFRVADPGAVSIHFDLVFGSDEYPEWVNMFVDGAIVLVNGVNYALFDRNPDRPLSVVSANLAAGYFQNNAPTALPIEYDGVSRALRIVAPILGGGALNTIKIAIADTGDHIYDSGLFLSGLQAGTTPGAGLVTRPSQPCSDASDAITGGASGESFDLLGGDDSCYSGGGSDIIDAGAGNDSVDAGSGDDFLKGGSGDDVLQGGSGVDTATYTGNSSAYQINVDPVSGLCTVTALPGGGGDAGSDQLSGIERLSFDDGVITLAGGTPTPPQPPTPPAPVNAQGVLVITGIGAAGSTLQAELSDADGLSADPILWSWEFLAPGATTWELIGGATEASFAVGPAQAGGALRVRAQYSDAKGYGNQPLSAAKEIQDLETGDALIDLMLLEAPVGAGVQTPLTTVLVRLITLGLTPAQAGLTLAQVLGLPPGIKLHTYNALQRLQQAATASDPVALRVEAVTLQLAVIASLNNDDTAGQLALGLLKASAQGKVLDLSLAADVAFVLGVELPPLGLPPLVAEIITTTAALASEAADGGTWQGMEAIWHDFLNLHQGVVAPSLSVLSLDLNVAPTGHATAALPWGVRDQAALLTPAQLLQGFEDDDLDPLSIASLTASGGGQLLPQADGSWLFQPDPGFVGSVELSYQVVDPSGAAIAAQQLLVIKPPNHPGGGTVLLSGGDTAIQGTPLLASHSLTDLDGLGLLSVSWSADGQLIAGASGWSFSPGQAQVGRQIRARVSYSDGLGYGESQESLPSAPVANRNDPATGTVSINGLVDGTATQGDTLSASHLLADLDGLGEVSFNWFADDQPLSRGATTLLLTQAHVGKRLRVEASFTDGFGTLETVSSLPTAPILNRNDAPTGGVSLLGPASVGIPLEVAIALQDLDGLGPFLYQWLVDGQELVGATAPTLMLTSAQQGHSVAVRVSYVDGFGQLESATSAGTAPVGLPVVVNLTGGVGADRLLGNALADTLRGGGGDDTLVGYAGADLLVGGDGLDRLLGGEGGDLYLIELARDHQAAEVEDLGTSGIDELRFAETKTSTLTLFSGDRGLERVVIGTGTLATAVSSGTIALNIDATAAPNGLTLIGNAGRNQLLGTAFDDQLNGGLLGDDLRGGPGNDVYVVDNTGDVITENLNQGVDLVLSSVSYTLAANVNDLELTGTAANSATGNSLANRILGTSARNVIDGGAGLDLLNGRQGGDLYLVAAGSDHPGAEFADTGLVGVDEVRFISAAASDTLTLLEADQGIEQVLIGTGVATAPDIRGKGALNVNAAAVLNSLLLSGNDGNNSLVGTAFADRLQGRLGNDILTGGAGADSFLFDTAPNGTSNLDRITDFQPGVDKIHLKSTLFRGGGATGSPLAAPAFRAGAGLSAGLLATDRILLNTSTGLLSYDADGSGKTGAVGFAQLPASLASLVTAADFLIIA
jgi:Ca2+-binding RTX toxin-like protein